jgi:Uma2 family endonuclease
MKAVIPDVSEHFLAERKRKGHDRWDEMWNGVLHMPASPRREHQDFCDELIYWLREHWARPFGNRVHREVNLTSIGGWPDDYRIPDLLLVDPVRFHIDHDIYFEGPPLVVVEIHSPGDEAYEKLDFYAELGVPEAWIIHRDTRKPQLFALKKGEYLELSAADDGWLASPATGIRMKSRRGRKLMLQHRSDEATRRMIPE